MSQTLDIRTFPLHGSQLIEASAGTGKTFTIALLYTRLILQHGAEAAFKRVLSPEDILVVTFTDAATQELKDRIRTRLSDAARCFMGHDNADDALLAIRGDYDQAQWPQCARLLSLAAQSMDQSAVSTIHGWCYRMLREHAFDSGSLFHQELVSNQRDMQIELMRDYWRQHFYSLDEYNAGQIQALFADPDTLLHAVRPLINKTNTRLTYAGHDLDNAADLTQALQAFSVQNQRVLALEDAARHLWADSRSELENILDAVRPALNQVSYKEAKTDATFAALKLAFADWANGDNRPDRLDRFAQGNWKLKKIGKSVPEQPEHPALRAIAELSLEEQAQAESKAPDLRATVLAHASHWLENALRLRLQEKAELGFDDLLLQLDRALGGPAGQQLAARIRQELPVAMIDEFQDTDPLQYRIFDRIYRVASNSSDTAIIMIGDPKQAIYSFRHADIHTYLQARQSTQGRHYNLAINYRSSVAAVNAVNYLFLQAENYEQGAFRFKTSEDNPLPFLGVSARGRDEYLIIDGQNAAALNLWHLVPQDDIHATVPSKDYISEMATRCAGEISRLLSTDRKSSTGFVANGQLTALRPKDIAILVRSRMEADQIRDALQDFRLPSVYLSDRESVFNSLEAQDMLRWLRACAEPGDERKLRAALATRSLNLSLTELTLMANDEFVWEEQTALFRHLHTLWQTQGVLPMLRALMQHYQLPQRLTATAQERQADGERRLTNLLHLAEYLQKKSSQQYEGEQALIRHLAEQIQDPGEEEILRLESDEDLIRVVTIHKSKGLEYPLVFLPFVAASKQIDGNNTQVMIVDEDNPGQRRLEIAGSKSAEQAWEAADQERLAEDLRLLYVALTRARHALWLGVACISKGNSRKSALHLSALGYLMSDGKPLEPQDTENTLKRWAEECADIVYQPAPDPRLRAPSDQPDDQPRSKKMDKPALISQRSPAENWWIASYSALKTGAVAASPELASDDQVVEESIGLNETVEQNPRLFSRYDDGLHGFHRGPGPGTFLHSLLEWAAEVGFDEARKNSGLRREEIQKACELRGWQDDIDRLDQWLSGFLATRFQLTADISLSLCELDTFQAELEFLFASHHIDARQLDALCQRWLLTGKPRPALQQTTLNGMIKGFIDLVFEYQGRYYVADWKSNYLGSDDKDYKCSNIEAEVLHSRYDVQYAIYLLALHRLLGSRLPDYSYEKYMGGAVYFFLRGWRAESQGLLVDTPPREFVEAMDTLFLTGQFNNTNSSVSDDGDQS